MSKFTERAKELKARLLLLCLEEDCVSPALMAAIEKQSGESSRMDELESLSLDVRILLWELNCRPLYEEACRDPKNPDFLISLLEHVASVENLRQR